MILTYLCGLVALFGLSACGADATAPGGSGLIATDTVELIIRRFDGGSGELLVSTGIPLAPGALASGAMDRVALVVDGEERSIHASPLVSRHPDGTLRSVLIQFRFDFEAGRDGSALLLLGPDISRSQPDLERSAVAVDMPDATALPASPDYLAATLLVGPTVTVSQLPLAHFSEWQRKFQSDGRQRWERDDQASIATHQYDRTLVWYAGWVRTGDPEYWKRGTRSAIEYRQIASPHGYSYQPHFQEPQGLEVHYLVTGNELSQDGVRKIAEHMDNAFRRYVADQQKEWMDSRIQARIILSAMVAARLEVGGKDWAALARDDLSKILTTQGEDGAMRWVVWNGAHSVFMSSLLIHALIKYYTWFERDERIPPFVKGVLDFVHPQLWLGNSWQYTSADPEATVDLNQLNAVGYAWYGWLSGEELYSEVAESAFRSAVNDAWLGGWKHFNQNYRSSFETAYYLLSR